MKYDEAGVCFCFESRTSASFPLISNLSKGLSVRLVLAEFL